MKIFFLYIFYLIIDFNKMFCLNYLKRGFCIKRNVKENILELDKSLHNRIKKNSYDNLINIEYNDTKRFIPPISYGKVIKVYDGDTITIASKIPNTDLPMYRFSVRLSGIDSPEIKGQTEKEKMLAKDSRDALHKLIYGKIIHLQNVSIEKYGRLLADIYLDNLHINNWMLENNYAVPYDGGKKIRPEEWDEK